MDGNYYLGLDMGTSSCGWSVIYHELRNNNAYATLEKCDGLIKTGPTGTNVNDVTVLLIEERNI